MKNKQVKQMICSNVESRWGGYVRFAHYREIRFKAYCLLRNEYPFNIKCAQLGLKQSSHRTGWMNDRLTANQLKGK